MKKLSLILIIVATTFWGCNQANKSGNEEKTGTKKIVIGATMLSMQHEFIVEVANQIEKKAQEEGIELIMVDAERSALKQIEQVESFIAQKVDVIILNPCEVEASSPAVTKAIAAGIPVVNVNSGTSTQPTAFVGSNDIEAGKIAMKFIADKLGGKGNIAMIHGYMGQTAQIQREQGAREILQQYPNLKLITHQTAEWDRAKGMDLMENWIQSYGTKINAVFSQNDDMAMGAVNALVAAGLKDKIIVVGIDAMPDALQAVKQGTLDATVFQDAQKQGAGAIETAIKIARKQPFEKETFIPFQLVTKENVAQFKR